MVEDEKKYMVERWLLGDTDRARRGVLEDVWSQLVEKDPLAAEIEKALHTTKT